MVPLSVGQQSDSLAVVYVFYRWAQTKPQVAGEWFRVGPSAQFWVSGPPPWTCCLPHSQPHPDEGHPPPLEAVPVPWKSVGPCRSHRESPGGLAESPGGEEAQGEEGPAAAQLDVLRLRSSSMEIREKGSEFLKDELHKAQKVGLRGWRGQGAPLQGPCALPEHPHGGRAEHEGSTEEKPVLVTSEGFPAVGLL